MRVGQVRGGAMSDTFFTAPSHWRWLVIVYFFVGGIAGGSYFIAALLDLFGEPRDRPVVRLGYYVALLGSMVSAVARIWLNAWGALLVVGVLLVGILLPLILHLRPRLLGHLSLPVGAALLLFGGFLMRVVIVLSSEGV
jgi:formate-dependent nitrite reductase membrane component NrfD